MQRVAMYMIRRLQDVIFGSEFISWLQIMVEYLGVRSVLIKCDKLMNMMYALILGFGVFSLCHFTKPC